MIQSALKLIKFFRLIKIYSLLILLSINISYRLHRENILFWFVIQIQPNVPKFKILKLNFLRFNKRVREQYPEKKSSFLDQ